MSQNIPEGWQKVELGKLGRFSKGKGILKEQVKPKGLPCIRYGEIYTAYDYVAKNLNSFIDHNTAKESQKIAYGDILFAGSGETIEEIGKSVTYLGNEEAYAGGDVIIFSPADCINPVCLSYLLETDAVRKQKRRLGQGHSVVHIYPTDLKSLSVDLPSRIEQDSIALLLSQIDENISTVRQLIAQKELRKKWLMQQLLTGKKRLKGFKSDWSDLRLGELFKRVTQKNDESNTTVVTISAQRGFVRQEEFFTKQIASESLDHYFLVNRGDFCYNKSYSNGYPWGATKRLKDFEKAVVTTLYICFSIKQANYSSGDFFEHFFEAGLLDKGLTRIAHEGGRAHGLLNVTPDDFFSLKVAIPEHTEQLAIAAVLDLACSEIQLLKSKLDQLKEQKKGMMQVLLTGKKRLKLHVEEEK